MFTNVFWDELGYIFNKHQKVAEQIKFGYLAVKQFLPHKTADCVICINIEVICLSHNGGPGWCKVGQG